VSYKGHLAVISQLLYLSTTITSVTCFPPSSTRVVSVESFLSCTAVALVERDGV